MADQIRLQPDEEERIEPAGKDDPNQPKLFLSSEIASSGVTVVGEGGLGVRGKGFVADARFPVRVFVDGAELKIKPPAVGKDGTFRLRIALPKDLAYGGHVIEVRQKTDRGERRVAAQFVKAHLEEELGEEAKDAVRRPKNDKPSDEGPLEEQEKPKGRQPPPKQPTPPRPQ